MVFIEKNSHVSGPAQFKPVLFSASCLSDRFIFFFFEK